ncbi:MAG TPA: lipoate--protein ligase family protein [Candidatus Brocadiia bacterium]|nr:biotin/lipoate A/B protein ligase family protein [Candidatus Brocadiales bacterium]
MWRYIEDNNVSASFGLAADEYLVTAFNPPHPNPLPQGEREGRGSGILRLYTYKSHCALVGRFQDVEKELNLEECKRRGIAVNRRPTGGGAILMGEDQLGIAIVSPLLEESRGTACRAPTILFETYSKGVALGLRRLGIEAEFRPKNDMLVNGKKIAGLALFVEDNNNMLFHASVLLDMDISLMLSVLNISQGKLSGKGINTAGGRITTVAKELGRKVFMRELRDAIKLGFQDAFAVEFNHEPFNVNEITAIKKLEERKYKASDWVYNSLDT